MIRQEVIGLKMTGAQAIVRALELEKTDTIFGYPGAAISPFYDALPGSGIRHILTRHEQGAAHAANGYARVTGRVGVCVATSGPGATNLITGIANAWMDSIPVIAVTGQVASGMIGTDAFQEADITGATAPFCKHNYLVKKAEELPEIIKKAFHIAATGRPGPVVIDVPVDVQNSIINFKYPESVEIKGYKPTYKGHPLQIKKAAAAVGKAKAPVICSGGGVISANATEELRELAEGYNIPVVTTLMGIGSIPSAHPLHLGMVGEYGSRAANYALSHADLILILGARVGDRAIGTASALAKKAGIIHIDIDPAEIGKNINASIPVVGDVKSVLRDILSEIKPGTGQEQRAELPAWQKMRASEKFLCNERLPRNERPTLNDRLSPSGTSNYVNPRYLLSILSGYLPENAVITTEVGQNQIWAANYYHVAAPRTFITSGGLGTMGYGLPAAVGAKLGRPEAPAVVISGDGSFQMSLQELGTIKHYGIGVKIILLNNCRLGMVRELQLRQYGGRYSQVYLDKNPDFVMLAAAYGIKGERIKTDQEIGPALERLADGDGPYLLECMVDPMEPTL